MLVGFVRFLRGYVDFSAKGSFPERFLNITARYGISLWDAEPTESGLKGSMYAGDYRRIRKTARKTKMVLKIEKKHGFPFLFNRYKSRMGIPVGALAGLILILVLSNFLWSVTISGNTTISEAKLREVLAESGVYVGAYKGAIDTKNIERDIQLKLSKVGWMSINITGNLASVEIKENVEKPYIDTNKNPCNLKAKCDGVITKINVRSGVTEVLKGSGVTKGDLLVSGVAESNSDRVDTLTYLRANGEIFADVNSKLELNIPKSLNYYSITENNTTKSKVSLLWLSFPASLTFTSYKDYASDYSTQSYCLNDVVLPIGVTTQTDYEIQAEDVTINSETANQLFENEALLYELFARGKSSLVSRNLDIAETDNSYSCTVDYVFNENIAESVDFSVTE